MIQLTSTKTGQNLGTISLVEGSISLDPESIRRLMLRLADSEIGHLVNFEFETHVTRASCLFGSAVTATLTLEPNNEN